MLYVIESGTDSHILAILCMILSFSFHYLFFFFFFSFHFISFTQYTFIYKHYSEDSAQSHIIPLSLSLILFEYLYAFTLTSPRICYTFVLYSYKHNMYDIHTLPQQTLSVAMIYISSDDIHMYIVEQSVSILIVLCESTHIIFRFNRHFIDEFN